MWQSSYLYELKVDYSRTPHIRTPVIRTDLALRVNLPRILEKYMVLKLPVIGSSTVSALWLLELQIRRGRKVYTQVHTVNSNSRTANCQFSTIFKEKFNYPDFPACPDGSPSQFVRINEVPLQFLINLFHRIL